jgi:hypothetical protein
VRWHRDIVRRTHAVHPAPVLGGGLPGHARHAPRLASQAGHSEAVVVLSAFTRAVPCVADAALRPFADCRLLTAGRVLGDHGTPGARRRGRLCFEVMFPAVRMPGCTRRQAWQSQWRGGGTGVGFALMRVDGRRPGWHACGCCGRPRLWCSPCWRVAAKYRHRPRQQAVRRTACFAQILSAICP